MMKIRLLLRRSLVRLALFAAPLAAALLASTASLPMALPDETGVASVYAYESEVAANGETATPVSLTAAHRTLPFGTRLMITNPRTGQSVIVTVNDRGPYAKGVTLDLTRSAALAIGMSGTGAVCMAKM